MKRKTNYRQQNRRRTAHTSNRERSRDNSRSNNGRGSSSMARRRESSVLHIAMLITTLAAGIIMYFVDHIIFQLLEGTVPYPVLVGLTYSSLFIVLMLVVIITGSISGSRRQEMLFGNSGVYYGVLAGASLIAFGMGAVFQWIYGLNAKEQAKEMSSIIFVMDNSGSMVDSDPNNLRYAAIDEVLQGVEDDFPYMVYGFSSGSEIMRGMNNKADGLGIQPVEPSGMTEIKGILDRVLDDYSNDVWAGGEAPKVVLLTDGFATDMSRYSSLDKLMGKYRQSGISISTVDWGRWILFL